VITKSVKYWLILFSTGDSLRQTKGIKVGRGKRDKDLLLDGFVGLMTIFATILMGLLVAKKGGVR